MTFLVVPGLSNLGPCHSEITLIVNNEDVGIDETTPIIHPMAIEAALDALVMDLVKICLEVATIPTHGIEEKHAGIET